MPDTDTLAAHSAAEPPHVRTLDIPIAQIRRDPNHRTQEAIEQGGRDALDALARSIEEHGLLQPVRVYEIAEADLPKADEEGARPAGKRYVLGYGYRRLAACEMLGRDTIRAEVHPPADAFEIETARALENLDRQNLAVIEEVELVTRMLDEARSMFISVNVDAVAVVAAHLGKSESWVRDRSYMTRLCPAVRRLAVAGVLWPGHLREIAKLGDGDEQLSVAAWCLGMPGYVQGSPSQREKRRKEIVDRLISSSRDGYSHRRTVEEARREINNRTRPLDRVGWELTQRVDDLPACDGCKDNTATDEALFGSMSDLKAKAYCLNRDCYERKQKLVEVGIKDVTKQLRAKKAEPSASNVDAAKPDWLKRTTAQRVAKRELGPAPKAKADKAKTPSGSVAGGAATPTSPDVQLEHALGDYRRALLGPVSEALNARVEWAGSTLFLLHAKAIQSAQITFYGNRKVSRNEIEQAVAIIESVYRNPAAAPVEIDGEFFDGTIEAALCAAHEDVLIAIAKRFGLDVPAKPKLEDFQPPPPEPDKPTKKKAATGKGKSKSKKAGKAEPANAEVPKSGGPPPGHDQPNDFGVFPIHQVIEIAIPKSVGRLAIKLGQGPRGLWYAGYELDLLKNMGARAEPVSLNTHGFDTPAEAARFRLVRMRDEFQKRAKDLPVKPASVYKALDKASKQIDDLIAAAPWRDTTQLHDES